MIREANSEDLPQILAQGIAQGTVLCVVEIFLGIAQGTVLCVVEIFL